jgi:NADPH:quinone reductase-like Zn-dependent oxidoreductase
MPCGRSNRTHNVSKKTKIAGMQCVQQEKYGPPLDVLSVQSDVPVPEVQGEKEVVVEVHCVSTHAGDWHTIEGRPYIVRAFVGLGSPKNPPGMDFSGVVTAIGSAVTRVAVGDAVLGHAFESGGAFAEFIRCQETCVAKKPDGVSFEKAAALPVSATTAMDAVQTEGKIQSGHKVLVIGASGGVGHFAVMLASHLGATVTGVCSGRNTQLVQDAGADEVIDYTQEDFWGEDHKEEFDRILDCIGGQPLSHYRQVLKPDGFLVRVGDSTPGDWIAPITAPLGLMFSNIFNSKKCYPMISMVDVEKLDAITDLLAEGVFDPVLDDSEDFGAGLDDVARAVAYVQGGHARGKVVIQVKNSDATDDDSDSNSGS